MIIAFIYYFFMISKEAVFPSSITQSQEVTEIVPTYMEELMKEKQKDETISIPEPEPLPVGVDRFIVSLNATNEIISANLLELNYIKDADSFTKLLTKSNKEGLINPGAYKISHDMTDSQLIRVMQGPAYMKWIKIPEGLRKEEIAELLAKSLGWSAKQKENWIKIDKATKPEYQEGVYFPETYLIPVDEEPSAVAKRLIAKFNEKFSIYLPQFTAKNIKWTTALTLASIVQREASNNADTPLISGILWNRLNQDMQLGVDATLQYIRGDKGQGWWAPITVADKKTASLYNTYINKGLPPHPISNPGVSAIEAVLNPTKTDCLYYLHGKDRITHCAVTYEEHKINIEKYLK